MTDRATHWQFSATAEQVVARCRTLARITDVPGQTTRTFLSHGMRRANAQVATWMQELGMATHTDAAGNLHGVLPGTHADAAPLLLVSHLDTVPDAGAFDGVLGVVLALALVSRTGGALPFPLRVIALSEEEGVRFGTPFLGSRALVGTLDEALLARTDREGVSVRDAIVAYGLHCEDLPAARLARTLGCLEFHIEQGPILEAEELPLGVVEAIAGQSHCEVCFLGTANHAGTTPMHLRRDAMVTAALWIGQVEMMTRSVDGVVATVGAVRVLPGARNVVPGEVRCTLDVRSAQDTVRRAQAARLVGLAREIGAARGIAVDVQEGLQQDAVAMDPTLTQVLAEAVAASGLPMRRMTSGAGHDAMILAPHLPTTMLFLRTPSGLSHHPNESVATEDVAAALDVGAHFLQLLALRKGTS